MECSQLFGFLNIFGKSIKQLFKNIKVIAPITAVCLLLSSILFIVFSFVYQFAIDYFTISTSGPFFLQIIIFSGIIFALELTCLLAFKAISDASCVATVTATADSSGLSLGDVYARVKAKWRRKKFQLARDPMHLLWIIVSVVVVVVVMKYPNPVTITIASGFGVVIFVLYLYSTVVWTLAGAVIVVVEEGAEAEAVERAEKLVEGQRVDGFMVNLFFYILCVILVLSFWMIVGDQGSLNLTVYGLFFVNAIVFTRIFLTAIYTVYYFRCKDYHSHQIQLPGDFLHESLVTNDLP